MQGMIIDVIMLATIGVDAGIEKCLECHDEKKQFELNTNGKEILKTHMCE